MPTVLHIDDLSSKDAVALGQRWLDEYAATGMASKVTVERSPRKLLPEAAAFIASYKREDPSAVLAVFWRYHSLEAEEFDTVEEAERFIEGGEQYGSLAGEAIVHGDQIRVLD